MIRFPTEIDNYVRWIGQKADYLKIRAYIVGGLVRDILLYKRIGKENILFEKGKFKYELDILVEERLTELLEGLAAEVGASVVYYHKFGTAKLILQEGESIDFAQARRERYPYYGALPRVEASSLKEDLKRRDFTINAMAIGINKDNLGQIFDYFGGIDDLNNRLIRALHKESFLDDPTRIFRAVRFSVCYNFRIERDTRKWIVHAVKREMFDKISGERIWREVRGVLGEKNFPDYAYTCIKTMHRLHELRFIHPQIVWNREKERLLKNIYLHLKRCITDEVFWFRRQTHWYLVWFLSIVDGLDLLSVQRIIERFHLTKADRLRLLSYVDKRDRIIAELSKEGLQAHNVYNLLHPLSYEVIFVLYCKAQQKRVRLHIRRYLEDYQDVRIYINSKGLLKRGIPPEKISQIKKEALEKKIDRLYPATK